MAFVSRAGEKLDHALKTFEINVEGLICADFGASTGGFTDCLLQHGAKKVYAVETGYGVLDYKLRKDPRVVVMERTNAMHAELPEKADLVTIDTSWTKLEKVVPNALKNLKAGGTSPRRSELRPREGGRIIALLKPHYEAEKGYLKDELIPEILKQVKLKLNELKVEVLAETLSPILGEKGKNKEFLLLLNE